MFLSSRACALSSAFSISAIGPLEKITDMRPAGQLSTPAVNFEPAEHMICVENDPNRSLAAVSSAPPRSN
jgi:hypothetical protein